MNFHEYWFKHLHHMHNTRICIFLQDICKTRNFHLHNHLVAFTSLYPCWGKFMHHKHIHYKQIHLHLHPRERHLHYKHIHLHLHPHKGHLHYKKYLFVLSYGYIHVCISNKDVCTRHSMNKHLYLHLHLHPHEGHLHYKKFSFAPSYGCIHVCISDKKNCIRHSMNKHKHLHLHLHLHLHPYEEHLHNKILIRTITRLRSCLHIQ